MPEAKVEAVDDRITLTELVTKPDGSVNRNTKQLLTDIGRLLFQGLRVDGEDDTFEIDSVNYKMTRLLNHTVTLGQTFEGQEILDAITEVKAAMEVLNAKMATVKGLKYTINQE